MGSNPLTRIQVIQTHQVAALMAKGKSAEEAQAMVAGLAQKLGFSVGA